MLPAEIIDEFRTVALDRLKRIETCWTAVFEAPADAEQVAVMHREAHNLKGESRLVSFTDVNLLCHKLEDLFELAKERGYRVTEDIDLAITMTTRFMAMLLRKKAGAQVGGIDLPGFLKHLDSVIAEARVAPAPAPQQRVQHRPAQQARLPAALREVAGLAAVDVFLEGIALGRSGRLATAWQNLRDLIAIEEPQGARQRLEKHQSSALEILRELGRTADVRFEVGDLELPGDVIGALDVALLHLLRNAIDHGIEPPEKRYASGRSPTGQVTVRATLVDEVVTLTVSDDGPGIDYELVRSRAVALRWIDAAAAETVTREELTRLLMQPGFSTRSQATDLSGRGVGLDAVAAAITAVGGTVRVDSSTKGTTWIVEVPIPNALVEAYVFRAPGFHVPLAIRADWAPHDSTAVFVDLLPALGLGEATQGTVQFAVRRSSGRAIGFVSETGVRKTRVRRLVTTPQSALAEVVIIDGAEGLLLRPERLPLGDT